jgi:hypothetical protein
VLKTVGNNLPERGKPCGVRKLMKSLKLRKAYGNDGVPNECISNLTRPLVHLTHLFNH